MIKHFKHKGLEMLWTRGDEKHFNKHDIKRISNRLAVIHRARTVEEINLPSFKLHRLKGEREAVYAVTVRANYRITFEFINGNAYILNYEDYH
ncbi:type II toxin-antitoxin system RelE/ParE family toxin [Shimwellia blattae]|uniref:Putative proteic killer suppression protein n=1 Tax=Shimwellia blattae (strain ATCC 29907 / DSM 4481 / JCM 1650 / NBRC 105725 / CDC 9005-74) TaxID=630626 RepID=I2B606_SHIBC|nr:type II toxin-antitoxin system RelE/ParE family toxin [Shimwellia blattae]AFJ45960.1 putative proteic killer suppression protein [Shimwellia blattae DSM 4481 = NBRC 105725]GAB81715.1 putative plasmid maintenance system killer family protein [Shimwellia blattae DSM 4481 = NBRC 105725]VDY63436.1 Plasmid maintenance system killer protein [Shimwellia blattae]VEC21327.1 Plasmid maintenance system killer protein [Shimwellia blattae]